MKKITIKCIVAAINSNGSSDLFFVKIEGNQDQIDAGEHIQKAKEAAEKEGYDAFLVYDEDDSAGNAMLPLFNWDTASIVTI